MAQRVCECGCGRSLAGRASRTHYFESKCRAKAFHERKKGSPTVQIGTSDRGTVAMVTAQLEQAGRLDTYLGAAAVRLAEMIDNSRSVMGFAALVKQLMATMDAATAGATAAEDPVDELRARRDRLRAG